MQTKSHESYQRLLNGLPLGLMILSRDGKITFMNRFLAERFNSTARHAVRLGDWLHEAFPRMEPYQRDQLLRPEDSQPLQTSSGRTHTFAISSVTGEDRIIRFTFSPVDPPDLLLICEDLTERKKDDAQMEHAHKMEAISSLAGSVAHDVNNLLMGIQGYVSLLLIDTPPADPRYTRLKAIESQIVSGTELTEQLLEYSRGGRFELKTVDLNDILSRIASSFSRSRSEIRINERYSTYVWAVEADVSRIEHVFSTLLIQLANSMAGGGQIHLKTENAMIDPSRAVLLGVKSGPYVQTTLHTPDLTAFDKSQFVKGFTSSEAGGNSKTLFNLASIQGIMRAHAGSLEATLDAHGDVLLILSLPASSKTPHVASHKAVPVRKQAGNETILLVDDEKVITDVTGSMLRALGYQVITASDGEESVRIYEKHQDRIDLIIMDVVMPGMGGGEAIELIRQINPHAKIILSSGYSMSGAVKAIMDKGIKVFLKKPYRMDDCSKKIREALEG